MDRLRNLSRALALPTLSGVLYFLSWIGWGVWPLAFVCFVPLLVALRGKTPRQALGRGMWMGYVTHSGGYVWIIHMLRVFAFLPTPLAVLGYVLLCAAQGGLFGAVAWLLAQAQRRSGLRLVLLLPLVLCAVEWLYPLLFQSYSGVALLPLRPLVQIADLGGVILLSALQALVNGAIADVLLWFLERRAHPERARPLLPLNSLSLALLCLGGAFAYGQVRIVLQARHEQAAPHESVGIAQPNVGEIALHDDPMASVNALWQETAELHGRGAELVVWPETGFNARGVDIANPAFGRYVSGAIPVDLIAGVVRVDRQRHLWNSALAISKEGLIGDHYDKIKLLAFGEYIPFGETFPVVYRWSPMSSHLTIGTTTAPLRMGRYRFATIICYEDILPGIVRDVMSDYGEGRAHAIVNLTNDSWYGPFLEQEQHLALATVRSIEHRRWLIRATSTGISAFVDSTGKVVQRIEQDVRGVAVRDVPMLEGTTAYEALGDWPGYVSVLVLAGIFVQDFRRRRRARAPVSGTV